MKQLFLLAFSMSFCLFSCAQKVENDTPEAFLERFRNAHAEPSRAVFADQILISKTEHRELSKAVVAFHFDWDKEPPNPAVEKKLDDFHEELWPQTERGLHLDFEENTRFDSRNFWSKLQFSDIKIDSSAEAVGTIFFESDVPKSVRAAQISANSLDPKTGKTRVIRAPVCRISGGSWKVFAPVRMTD